VTVIWLIYYKLSKFKRGRQEEGVMVMNEIPFRRCSPLDANFCCSWTI